VLRLRRRGADWGRKKSGRGIGVSGAYLVPTPSCFIFSFFSCFSFSYHSFAFVPIHCEGCLPFRFVLLLTGAVLLFTTPAVAFGAGNIVSVSQVAGKYWRHGGIGGALLELFMSQAGAKECDRLNVKRVCFVDVF